jgi:hypothetical protein
VDSLAPLPAKTQSQKISYYHTIASQLHIHLLTLPWNISPSPPLSTQYLPRVIDGTESRDEELEEDRRSSWGGNMLMEKLSILVLLLLGDTTHYHSFLHHQKQELPYSQKDPLMMIMMNYIL